MLAAAIVTWSCIFHPINPPMDAKDPPKFPIGIMEDQSHRLLTIVGDMGNSYMPIVEDTADGLIAIAHKPNVVDILLIDKKSGKYQHRSFVPNGYEDSNEGYCKKDQYPFATPSRRGSEPPM